MQKQNSLFKITTEGLKATLDDFSVKVNTRIKELDSNQRAEVVQSSEDPYVKRAEKRNILLGLKARQGIDPRLKTRQGKDTKN